MIPIPTYSHYSHKYNIILNLNANFSLHSPIPCIFYLFFGFMLCSFNISYMCQLLVPTTILIGGRNQRFELLFAYCARRDTCSFSNTIKLTRRQMMSQVLMETNNANSLIK
jgi:hypothetical protein